MNLMPIECERKIIRLMLSSRKTYTYLENRLKINHFSNKIHRTIFKFFMNYFIDTGHIGTCKIFINELSKKKPKFVNEYRLVLKKIVKEKALLQELPYYITETIKCYKARHFLRATYNTSDSIERGNVDNAIEDLQNVLSSLRQETETGIIREGGYIEGLDDRKKEVKSKNFYFGNHIGVPTGLKAFDRFYGGIFPEELGVIVGGAGKGKSMILLNFAVTAAELGLPVVIVTIEMSKMQYEYRLDSRITQIVKNKFRKKELTNDDIELWEKKIDEFKNKGKIYIIDMPDGGNTNLIEMKLREAERYLKTNKYLLIVDYLNLMHPNRKVIGSKHDWQVLGEISEDLKKLARKKHIPIWTAAQFTKKTANKHNMQAEDTGYSYKIAQDADFEFGISQTPEMEEEGMMKLYCMKGREGKIPAIECYPDFNRMLIRERILDDET